MAELLTIIGQNSDLLTIIITAITVLGGSSAFRYYEKRARHREKDENYIRYNCQEQISKLEQKLERSEEEKTEMREEILSLTREVATLRVKLETIIQENYRLNRK